jgi:tetratricopeptide (TPR) repeat protein
MRRSVLVVSLLVALVGVAGFAMFTEQVPVAATPSAQTPQSVPIATFSTEQEWIVSEIVTTVAEIARLAGTSKREVTGVQIEHPPASAASAPVFRVDLAGDEVARVQVVNHIWAPESYAAFAGTTIGTVTGAEGPITDLMVRGPLTDLSSGTLLVQAERVSGLLTSNLKSASAHESAALVVAALALQEASGALSDVRSELSRTTAHLVMAQALRGPSPEGLDGAIARAALTILAGKQREALQMVAEIEHRSRTSEDRAWVWALRLRITGDWRTGPPPAEATLLERAEYARALRFGRGDDAFLSYLDGLEPTGNLAWQRIAYKNTPNVELGHTFGTEGTDAEISEARHIWSRLHPDVAVPVDLTDALNERPAAGLAHVTAGAIQIQVLDWGRMAAFHQRHVAQSMIFAARHLWNLGRNEALDSLPATLHQSYGGLRLYPIVARWVARTSGEYEQALTRARPLVDSMPHVVTASAWNVLLDKPDFAARAAPFPFDDRWFAPHVPPGTLYDLSSRSLRPGCRRPPSVEQARAWAAEAPYDFWTGWSAEWYAATGEPAIADLTRALGPLLDYDRHALVHLLEHVTSSLDAQILTARRLCRVSPSRCDSLAQLLLRAGRPSDAMTAYEAWIAGTRDSVAVSNGITWIVRYYQNQGRADRAMELANRAAATGSSTGLETLAHALDRNGAYAEAQQIYERIAAQYNNARPLGVSYLRQGARAGDTSLQARGMELLRRDLPHGMERLALHALDATPKDGLALEDFGPRPAAAGLQRHDVLVGIDEWRIRSVAHYWVATRLSHDDRMTLTVWRDGIYKQFKTTVPERWLGVAIRNYVAPVQRP